MPYMVWEGVSTQVRGRERAQLSRVGNAQAEQRFSGWLHRESVPARGRVSAHAIQLIESGALVLWPLSQAVGVPKLPPAAPAGG